VPLLLGAGTGRVLPGRREWGWIALLGATSTGLGFAGMFLSVGAAGAAIPGVVTNSQALLVAPFSALFFGEPLGRGRLLGLLVGVAGVGLTVSGGGGGVGEIAGISLALMAAAGVAAGNLVTKLLGARVDALTATPWQYAVGGSLLLVPSVTLEGRVSVTWTPPFLVGLLFLAFVGSAGASWAWFRLIATAELVPLAGLTLLSPGLALLLALIVYREPVTPLTSSAW
jgi:drug/metabolite transporter (DMT)-like permease